MLYIKKYNISPNALEQLSNFVRAEKAEKERDELASENAKLLEQLTKKQLDCDSYRKLVEIVDLLRSDNQQSLIEMRQRAEAAKAKLKAMARDKYWQEENAKLHEQLAEEQRISTMRGQHIEQNLAEISALSADLADCTRSHPHEHMSKTCELRTDIARLTNHLAVAEAKLKAASEQKPLGYYQAPGDIGATSPVYAAPIPPADVQELQRDYENSRRDTEFVRSLLVKAEQRIAELERKLAKQQAWVESLIEMDNRGEPDSFIVDCLTIDSTDGTAELNTILAQAREEGRKEAIPDGCQVVPNEVVNFWSFCKDCFVPVTSQHEQLIISLRKANEAMLLNEYRVMRLPKVPNECEQTRAWPERTVAVLSSGDTVIVVDDHCYAVRNWNGNEWGWSAWIFREAFAALKGLPDNPDEAVVVAENAL